MSDAAIAIPNLLYTYADFIDAGDFTGAARLFRHGAVVTGGQRIAGEDDIADLWRGWVKIYPDGTPRTRHLISNPIITLMPDGDAATCHSQWTVLQAAEGFPLQVIATGRYEDEFRRIDGEWQFIERRYAGVDLAGDMSAHIKKHLENRRA